MKIKLPKPILLLYSIATMSDASRFTPLYVTQMFLEMKYCSYKNLIIPEVLLECGPNYENNLRRDLKEIDSIANSGDLEKIYDLVTSRFTIMVDFDVRNRYDDVPNALFKSVHTRVIRGESPEELKKRLALSNIINQDVLKDLVPEKIMMSGYYEWHSVFSCIFRYILYVKTTHLNIFEQNNMNFRPNPVHDGVDPIEPGYVFNY